jgi:hypothetical protein
MHIGIINIFCWIFGHPAVVSEGIFLRFLLYAMDSEIGWSGENRIAITSS